VKPIVKAIVTFIDRADVDTDAILPKQYMRSIEKTGYGQFLFDGWRYLEPGDLGLGDQHRHLNQDFVPNQPRYQGAGILLCRRNFGSGSAREHAVWALHEYGLHVLIAPSYGDIFANNCLKNDVLPIVLPEDLVERLFGKVESTPGYQLTVDIAAQVIKTPDGGELPFTLDAFRKRCLLENLDDTSYALSHAQKIRGFEEYRRAEVPWLFTDYSE
jgi:3-isopropylmalate/(R)-2-methylmalate dehydratase small subunit